MEGDMLSSHLLVMSLADYDLLFFFFFGVGD